MMWSENKVLSKMSKGQIPYGIGIMLGNPRIVEIAGWAGFDFVQIDQEHTAFGFETIEGLIRAADAVGMCSIVRVAENNPKDIARVLEAGAQGVVVPQVRNAADVRKAIDAAHYEGKGNRGMCPVTRAARYNEGSWDRYEAWTRKNIMVIPLIENAEAIETIDEICALPEIDVIGFGAGDIGQSLGVGARGISDPQVRAVFDGVARAARKHDVLMKGTPVAADSPADAERRLREMGVGMVVCDTDALLFTRECRRLLENARGPAGEGDGR